jgi:glycosyltransferase involved in cell wall biosynthesis
MSKNTLVSVIIPTYNRAAVIAQTIEDVFGQTYKNIELIIVDDGSTDDTQAVLQKYGSRIRVVTQANAGPAAARNRGFEVSSGDIIAFQDSDDLWKPAKLERQVALLAQLGTSVPCCLCSASFNAVRGKEFTSFDMACIYPQREFGLWTNVADVLATRFILFNQTAAIRRRSFEQAGGFDQSLEYLEDYDLPLRLAMEGPWAFIREPLVIYREGTPDSFSKKAAGDPVVLKKCEIRIFERVLRQAEDKGDTGLQRQVRARLGTFQRLMISAELSQSKYRALRGVGAMMRHMDGLREKMFRRSPWYPKALTVSIEDSTRWTKRGTHLATPQPGSELGNLR